MTHELSTTDGGWNDTQADDRIIQGTLLRCVDGVWSNKAGTPLPKQLLALTTTIVLQRWENKKPAETIVKRPGELLPDIDELNAIVPEDEWEISEIDSKPRPPWQKQFVVYFLEPSTAAKFTYANGITGARIAVDNLKDQVQCMRVLRGANVLPLVELASVPMKTKFGQKIRPSFRVVSWHELGAGIRSEAAPQLEHKPAVNDYAEAKGRASNLKTVERPMTKEELDDEIPF